MTPENAVGAVQAALEAKPAAAGETHPSASGVVIYKVMGKMFAILTLKRAPNVILKCDPHLADASGSASTSAPTSRPPRSNASPRTPTIWCAPGSPANRRPNSRR